MTPESLPLTISATPQNIATDLPDPELRMAPPAEPIPEEEAQKLDA